MAMLRKAQRTLSATPAAATAAIETRPSQKSSSSWNRRRAAISAVMGRAARQALATTGEQRMGKAAGRCRPAWAFGSRGAKGDRFLCVVA